MLANLINNIAFLIALVAAGQVVISHGYKTPEHRQIVLGLLFGAVAMLGMANPVTFLPGVIFDGRTIVLAVAGVVGGALAAAIGAVMAALYRYQIGGVGAMVGIAVALLSATFGALARTWWTRRAQTPRWFDYLGLGVLVQVMQLTAFTQIPNRAGFAFIEQAGWVLMLFYPLATMLMCLMFRNFEQQLANREALQRSQDARVAEEKAHLQRFHAYFDQSIVGLAITSPEKGWMEVNSALCVTLGYTREELMTLSWPQLTHPDDLASDLTQFNRMLAGDIDSYAMDKRFVHRSGKIVYTRLAVSAVRKPEGRLDYVLAMVEDISDRHSAMQALELERAHLRTLVSAIPDLIWLKDVEGRYVSCNREFERFFGATESQIVGKTDHEFVPAELADMFRLHDRAAMAAGEPTRNEEWITYATDGRRVLLETTKVPMRMPDGRLVGVLGVGHDITERHAHQHQLEHMAHFDMLTGLPNRSLLADRLQQALAQAQRRKTALAIVYLDLDGFKAINDRFGHDVGDRLLKVLSEQMKHALREVDTLARLGGDEFVVIYLDLHSVESSLPLLSRLLQAVSETVQIDGLSMKVSASLGVTYYPQDDPIDSDQLLRQADQAMYQAKQMGKNRYHIFDAAHDRSVRGHHIELERLKHALMNNEFVLYYQPKVNMRTGEVLGVEALIRWQHPERGLLPPAAFLPMIADHPLAVDLGHWVLDTVMTQIENWKSAGLPLQISANIDAIHLEQADFIDRLRALKAAHPGVGPDDLELEVLETNALDDTARVSTVIRACQEMGIGFALDDFGTGYSSLTYLRQLPAQLLKIDQSFVRDMLEQPDDLSILEGIISLAKAFRRRVIAEGVETLAHGEMLLRLGCDLAQGYAVAKPMPADAVPGWAASWRPDPSWRELKTSGREQMPILSAWVEHRAWTGHVIRFLKDELPSAPEVHPDTCRFGEWHTELNDGLNQDEQTESELMSLHLDLHRTASELLSLKAGGHGDLAIVRIHELIESRDRFLKCLMSVTPSVALMSS